MYLVININNKSEFVGVTERIFMKKYILTFMIWVFFAAITELPLVYLCPNIQVVDIVIIDIYMILSIICLAGTRQIMKMIKILTKGL